MISKAIYNSLGSLSPQWLHGLNQKRILFSLPSPVSAHSTSPHGTAWPWLIPIRPKRARHVIGAQPAGLEPVIWGPYATWVMKGVKEEWQGVVRGNSREASWRKRCLGWGMGDGEGSARWCRARGGEGGASWGIQKGRGWGMKSRERSFWEPHAVRMLRQRLGGAESCETIGWTGEKGLACRRPDSGRWSWKGPEQAPSCARARSAVPTHTGHSDTTKPATHWFSRHQLGVWQVSSGPKYLTKYWVHLVHWVPRLILTLSIRLTGSRPQSHEAVPTFDIRHKFWVPRVLILVSDLATKSRGIPHRKHFREILYLELLVCPITFTYNYWFVL